MDLNNIKRNNLDYLLTDILPTELSDRFTYSYFYEFLLSKSDEIDDMIQRLKETKAKPDGLFKGKEWASMPLKYSIMKDLYTVREISLVQPLAAIEMLLFVELYQKELLNLLNKNSCFSLRFHHKNNNLCYKNKNKSVIRYFSEESKTMGREVLEQTGMFFDISPYKSIAAFTSSEDWLVLNSKYKHFIRTDYKACFDSIYSHTFTWLIGKDSIDTKSFESNSNIYFAIDRILQNINARRSIIAAIGLTTGAIDPDEDYGNEGLSWQKDSSWGSYYVTTLHAYEPVILKNALIYSDNIYFAKAALKIGENDMESSLTKLGFNDVLPFDIKMAKSQFSNTEKIEKEVQLADSGYGQGQILVNPLHMACMYSAFCNEGNMIKPYLTYKEDAMPDVWIKEAFTKDVAQTVLEDTKEVINNPHGTGYAAHRTDIILAGKTGTAEIKASKDDTTGTELGWFSVFTTDENMERPIMIVSMVEDVKGRGGSGYVVKKDSQVLEKWFSGN